MPTPKRQRQDENHAAKIAAEQAAGRARRIRRLALTLAAAVIVVLVVWLISRLDGTSASATTVAADTAPQAIAADYAGFRQQPTACGSEAPADRAEMTFAAAEDQELSGEVNATIETSCGPIQVVLDADAYPETVNSFLFLAREGYFDGTACHRIAPGFMVQCGDPTATGLGDPGYRVVDEFPQEGFVYERGVIAMANARAGTTGSQFFIVTGDASHLPPTFSVLGTVDGSDGILDALDAVPVGLNQRGNEISNPLESVYVETITIQG